MADRSKVVELDNWREKSRDEHERKMADASKDVQRMGVFGGQAQDTVQREAEKGMLLRRSQIHTGEPSKKLSTTMSQEK